MAIPNTEKDLIDFIEEKLGLRVNTNTLVFDELQIDGLDADLFMEEFGAKFDVNLSSFDPSIYYFSEYEVANIFLTFFRLFFHRKKLIKKSFPVSHLVLVIEKGQWIPV